MRNISVFGLLLILMVSTVKCKEDSSDLRMFSEFANDKICICIAEYIHDSNEYTPLTKVVSFDDIIGYNPSTQTIVINENASNNIKNYGGGNYSYPVTGIPFTILEGGKIILGGLFVPGYSSVMVTDKVCIDPLGGNRLILKLGYPGSTSSTEEITSINLRLTRVFQRHGKIITI